MILVYRRDIVIISCVRTVSPSSFSNSIGFVADIRRMNVAITRGKHALWIVGDSQALSNGSQEWKALVDDATNRDLIRNQQQIHQNYHYSNNHNNHHQHNSNHSSQQSQHTQHSRHSSNQSCPSQNNDNLRENNSQLSNQKTTDDVEMI